MKRGDFFKSVIGLIGVAGSLNELSLINTPMVELLPFDTIAGDIVMGVGNNIFLFDGKFLRNINDGKRSQNLAKPSAGESKYKRFSRACQE